MDYKKFQPLSVSSKFAICGIPLRLDTYKTCSFGCTYCFANNRKIMEFEKNLQIANLNWLERKLDKIYNKNLYNKESFLDVLLKERITWHCGGMSDPFQPIENKLHITKDMIDIANKYESSILFSTKSDNLYGCNIRPDLHSFQMSITNVNNRTDIEPNVPNISERLKLYKYLKKNKFKVGIRVQPFIPNITSDEIVDIFKDADYFTIEGLKLVPQNKEHKEYLMDLLKLNKSDFKQMGLLNLKPEIRTSLYDPIINKLKKYKIPYSIADNDLHYISSGKCCCGDNLIKKSTGFNNTAMIKKYGINYTLENVKSELGDCSRCKANQLFTSNRSNGCITVQDFYDERFYKGTSPFSPSFLYI